MAGRPKKPVTDDGQIFPSAYEPLHPQEPRPVPPSDSHPHAVPAAFEGHVPLKFLFQLSFDGVVLHELMSAESRGNFLRVNDAVCRLLGHTPEEMRDLTLLDILAPEELAAVPSDTEIMRREGMLVHEKTLIAKDGRRIRAEISSRLVELNGRQMAVSTIHDVTEHRQIEQALRESEERLRLALEGGGMGRWEWDLQADTWFWCERAREMLGLEPFRAVTTETFFERVHPQDKDVLRTLLKDAMNEQAEFQAEFRVIRRRDGIRRGVAWLASRGKVVRDERGKAVRMQGVLFDVTQRKQMEEQLRRLNDRLGEEVKARTEELRDTIDRLEDEVVRRVLAEGKLRKHSQMLEGFFQYTITPLAFLDRYLNFVRVNEAYAKAHDATPESFVSRDYFTMHPDEESRDIFRQVIETGQPYFAHARPFVHPGHHEPGVTYWDWQLTPVLNDAGDVQFLVLNMENVTRQQVAFQELERRARQLQNLTLELSQTEYRERSRLAEVLHDDLQQILAAAKFHVSMLCAGPRSNEEVQEISGQVNQMLREAIDRSRSLSHELSPAVLHQTDLDDTFEWLARQMESKHGLTVHLEVRGRVESLSQTLRAFLYKAAQELLFNVTKHAHTNEVRVRLQRMGGRLCLTISDGGRGFDPRAVTKTTGFGLLAIRERVELLGGRMKMRSAPGRGSTFLISIPDAGPPSTGDEGTSKNGACWKYPARVAPESGDRTTAL